MAAGSCTFLFLGVLLKVICISALNTNPFPANFLFGAATASYQIEGAWNESDKSEDIWSHLTHNYPELIVDRSNGDVACDSYHHIDDDVAMLQHLGVDFYRFSLSWTRLLPSSFDNRVSEAGLTYYNNLIDALIAKNITPMISIYHWDLPHYLQKIGGWANPVLVDYFTDFARIAYEKFGDRVKYWITFNEADSFCPGYGASNHAPVNVHEDGIGNYLCMRTVALSHASAYRLYNDTYKATQGGECGVTFASVWFEPNSTSEEDAAAADRMLQFTLGAYAHPIYSANGDFPEAMKAAIASRSAREGFPYSRLPEFTTEEINFMRGTYDFFGLNHYTSNLTVQREYPIGDISTRRDEAAYIFPRESWNKTASDWFAYNPQGFTNILLWIRDQYNNPKIIITESGYSDYGELDDHGRVQFYKDYMSAMLDAMDQGVNVVGYTAWSLMDNFEWLYGYTARFGLYYVNMSDPSRPRTAKSSAEYYRRVVAKRSLNIDEEETNNGYDAPMIKPSIFTLFTVVLFIMSYVF